MASPNVLKKIFWDYKRSFMGKTAVIVGLPLIWQMSGKMIIPPVIIFGSIITTQYLLTSSDYFDEYDGTASEFGAPK